LDIKTGEVEYVDCGHEQPLILRGATGEVEVVKKKEGGMPLCLVEDFPYFSQKFKLEPGDVFLSYTDGLEDALNDAGVRIGIDPTKELLKTLKGMSPAKVNETVLQNVNEYIGSASQFDDITLLTLRYNGK
jgi:phosphoserine phosphatase RsbU/P